MTKADPTTTTPRWADETLDNVASAYDAELSRHGANLPCWAMLPIEAQLVLIAVYCAGRRDGGR